MKDLARKVAVITGAGSGIGEAVSLELALRGCAVALVDINKTGLESVRQRVERLGRRASVHRMDVSRRDEMEKLPGAVLGEHGQADILVNNAGVALLGSFADHTIEDFEWIIGINVWGVIYGCKFFLPLLENRPEAHIVNISSIAGFMPIAGMPGYVLTKHAVRGFSETLRAELASKHIGVTCVHPGAVRTNIPAAARYRGKATTLKDRGRGLVAKFGVKPESAARQIADAIQSNEPRLLIGPDARVLDALSRLMPKAPGTLMGLFGK